MAVCVALPEADPKEVVENLQKLAKTGKIRKGIPVEYVAVPSPLLCPESGETLRKADAFLLAVPARAWLMRFQQWSIWEWFPAR